MEQHPIFNKYKRDWLHEVTGFSKGYLCRLATGRIPLSRSFIEQACLKLEEPQVELFLFEERRAKIIPRRKKKRMRKAKHPGVAGTLPASSIYETRNRYIKERRDAGATLREIGEDVGRSGQRIHRILIKDYGTADIGQELLTTAQLIELANCSKYVVHKLRHQGIISRVARGRWSLKTLDIVLERRRRY